MGKMITFDRNTTSNHVHVTHSAFVGGSAISKLFIEHSPLSRYHITTDTSAEVCIFCSHFSGPFGLQPVGTLFRTKLNQPNGFELPNNSREFSALYKMRASVPVHIELSSTYDYLLFSRNKFRSNSSKRIDY